MRHSPAEPTDRRGATEAQSRLRGPCFRHPQANPRTAWPALRKSCLSEDLVAAHLWRLRLLRIRLRSSRRYELVVPQSPAPRSTQGSDRSHLLPKGSLLVVHQAVSRPGLASAALLARRLLARSHSALPRPHSPLPRHGLPDLRAVSVVSFCASTSANYEPRHGRSRREIRSAVLRRSKEMATIPTYVRRNASTFPGYRHTYAIRCLLRLCTRCHRYAALLAPTRLLG